MRRPEPEYLKVKRSRAYSVLDGAFYMLMDGFTSSFVVPYALFLNASNLVISMLASFPDLFASFFQLLSIKASEVFKSRKGIIVFSALLQAALWLPIMAIPWIASGPSQGYLLIILYSALVSANYFIAPLWKSLMGDLISENERGSYFGMRNKIAAAVNFFSALAAGWTLQHFSISSPTTGFAILFFVAFGARVISSVFLAMMFDPRQAIGVSRPVKDSYTVGKFMKGLTTTDFGKFVLFLCIFRVAVSFSGPFFSVYDLKYLGFSYTQYTMFIAAEIIASIIFLGVWGRMNDERGSKVVILFSGIMIPAVPLLYLVDKSFYFILAVSFYSGAVWAGFNLAVGNFLLDAAKPEERVKYSAYFQLFHGLAVFVGSMMGGLFLSLMPPTGESILSIFVISGIFRLAVAAFLFPLIKEMRLVELPVGKSLFAYPLIIKPRHRFVKDPFDYFLAYPTRPKKKKPNIYMGPEPPDEQEERERLRKKQREEKMFVDRMLGRRR